MLEDTKGLLYSNLLSDVAKVVEAFKTVEYLIIRTLEGMVRDLYRMEFDEAMFVTELADLVQQQLTRAWREGMRINELDPDTEIKPEWEKILEDIILSEYNYVDQFAHDITQAAFDGEPWEPLLERARLWANRYNDVVNRAVIETKEQKLIWVYGDTEHCDTCLRLNGIVAWASEWDLANVRPQNPPNSALDCGGWRCQCSLNPTGNRHTPNAFDAIMGALG